jgi:SAM-dependent methyltransferase
MNWSLPQCRQPELMDCPDIDAAEHDHALEAIATINAVSCTAAQIAAGIRRLDPSVGMMEPQLVIADVACGGGDVTCDLARRLRSSGGGLGTGPRLLGLDKSPHAVHRASQRAARAESDVRFEVCDVLTAGLPPCDIAVCSLFLHHLDDEAASRLLRRMADSARRGFVVSDLLRSRLGLALAVIGTTLLSGSRVARVDGPLSVRAARTPEEYRSLCAAAGLDDVKLTRAWPERMLLTWRRPAGHAVPVPQ